MKLFALPEDVLNTVLIVLQELPFKTALSVINDVKQARLVVDSNNKPVEVPTQEVTSTEVLDTKSELST